MILTTSPTECTWSIQIWGEIYFIYSIHSHITGKGDTDTERDVDLLTVRKKQESKQKMRIP